MTMPRVVLVAGPPHGAATITSIVLGQHEDIFPVGEMHNFPNHRHFKEDRICTCGQVSTGCPFWLRVRELYAPHQQLPEEVRLPRLYEIIAGESGRPITAIVSHDIDRTKRLCRVGSVDLRLVHVIREGRAVVNARLRDRTGQARSFGWHRLRLTYGATRRWWREYDLLASIEHSMKERGVRVQYEELCRNPRETMQRLGDFLGLDLTSIGEQIAAGRPLGGAPHVLRGGSKFVNKEQIVLRHDDRFCREMSVLERSIYSAVSALHSARV